MKLFKLIKPVVLFFILFNTCLVYSQISVSASVNNNDAKDWNLFFYDLHPFEGKRMYQNSYELGLGYLIRMKKVRVDIHPILSHAIGKGDVYGYTAALVNDEIVEAEAVFKLRQTNLNLLTKIYPLSFTSPNKPNIPTKNKLGFKRGWYVLFNPSVSLLSSSYSLEAIGDRAVISRRFNSTEFRFGLGTGFDIGLPQNLTISPFIIWHKMKNVPNKFINEHALDICQLCPNNTIIHEEATQFNQVQIGINFIVELGKEK